MAAVVIAEDAVPVRKVRARGVSETMLRRQLAGVATPRVRRFVFIRRVRLRAAPSQIGRAMETALAKLAEEARQDILTFADFPALAVACAREALRGGLRGWHWPALGLSPMGTAGAAVAALLIAHPLEAGAAVAALAAQGLLAAVWRTVPEAAAAQLTASLALATGFTVPDWPDDPGLPGGVEMPSSLANLMARARAMWAEALAPLSPRSEAVRAAAVLAVLRWSPRVLRSGDRQVWQALLAHLTSAVRGDARHEERAGEPEPSRQLRAEEASAASERNEATRSQYSDRAPSPDPEAHATPDAPPVHGERISTGWGGVLFLINALRRLHIEVLLDAAGADAPTGWRLLHSLGLACGMPEDDPLAEFLVAQDLDSDVSPGLLAQVLGDIEALYEPDGPWPLPLAQPAVLRATETHLDLDLMAKDIDIALRLSGLDLDPGWVPWLGRVVAFHYDQLPTVFHRAG